jgi:hypothetical protein
MAILHSSTQYYHGNDYFALRPTRSALDDCQPRVPTIAQMAKVANLSGQLHRARLKKDKHLTKALEQQLRNITHAF